MQIEQINLSIPLRFQPRIWNAVKNLVKKKNRLSSGILHETMVSTFQIILRREQ